jgi:hypothetical protein
VIRQKKTLKKTRIKLYNTLALQRKHLAYWYLCFWKETIQEKIVEFENGNAEE